MKKLKTFQEFLNENLNEAKLDWYTFDEEFDIYPFVQSKLGDKIETVDGDEADQSTFNQIVQKIKKLAPEQKKVKHPKIGEIGSVWEIPGEWIMIDSGESGAAYEVYKKDGIKDL
jgi:hypothetical protein